MQSFVVYKEELNKRLDAWSYRPAYRQLIEDVKGTKWPVCNLIDVCRTIFCGPFGTAIKSSAYVKKGIPFIRITNIKSGYLDKDNLVHITPEDSKRLKSTQLNAGDLVISQRGTIGNVAPIPREFSVCNISANTIGVKVSGKVNTDYVLWFLMSRFGKIQFESIISGHIQNKITTDDVKNIKIPLLSRQIQDKIANIMDGAYKKQKEMLNESEKILNSIEPYLLKELGVKIPSYEGKSTFVIRFEDLKGKRFDVFHYQPKFQNLLGLFRKAKIATRPLGDFIESINYGASVKAYAKGEIPFLRIQNLKENTLVLDELLYVKKKELTNSDYVQNGDFLISRSGTVGMVARAPKEANGFAFGSFMIRFRLKTSDVLNPGFAWLFLNHKLGRMQSTMSKTGGVQGNITIPAIKNIQIPILNIAKQLNIVQEVINRQKAAEGLKHEAQQIIHKARQKVEKMFLEKNDNNKY